MFDILPNVRTNPTEISVGELIARDAVVGPLVVQFGEREACTPEILAALNDACQVLRGRLRVRFFGFYGDAFDAVLLRHLPDVVDLAVDSLERIVNEDAIASLSKLKRLSFGVIELDRPALLETIGVDRLERFSLGETRKRNVDLAPLSGAAALEALSIEGHWHGIGALATVPRLQTLRLRAYTKGKPLDFMARMPVLRKLTLILGGRDDIDDMSSATLEALQIVRVRGLTTLGDLSRFPSLASLWVEDQMQLKSLDLTGAQLERLRVVACRQLVELRGLDAQHRLREFSAAQVALDMDALRDRHWPATMRSVSLFAGKKTWNADAKARLAARGIDDAAIRWDHA